MKLLGKPLKAGIHAVKSSFHSLFLRLLGKFVSPEKMVYSVGKDYWLYSIHQYFEKVDDNILNQCIADLKDKDGMKTRFTRLGVGNYLEALLDIGVTLDSILEIAEGEKFLREHRKKYHGKEA